MSTPPATDMPSHPATGEAPPPDFRFFEKHGRFYGAWRRDKYLTPIDDEECHRFDVLQRFFTIAREEKLCGYDLDSNEEAKILDLGTGTLIFPVTLKHDYKELKITAVDLNLIQPASTPEGVRIKQFDIEEPSWDKLPTDYDFVHARLLLGSIKDDLWPQIYSNAIRKLLPRVGFFEQIEFDYTLHWADEIPPDCASNEWVKRYQEGMDRAGRSVRVDPERITRQLEEAGFVDIILEEFRCCLNPWSQKEVENDASRWFNYGVTMGLEAMGLVPMIEYGDLNRDQVIKLSKRARSELCNIRYQPYMTMYMWLGRKPSQSNLPPQPHQGGGIANGASSSAP